MNTKPTTLSLDELRARGYFRASRVMTLVISQYRQWEFPFGENGDPRARRSGGGRMKTQPVAAALDAVSQASLALAKASADATQAATLAKKAEENARKAQEDCARELARVLVKSLPESAAKALTSELVDLLGMRGDW